MFGEGGRDQLEFRDYLRIVRRRKYAVVLATLAVLGASLALSFAQSPVYAATAEVLRQTRSTETLFNPVTGSYVDPQRALQTEVRIIGSQPVRTAARDALGYWAPISASPAGQTNVIRITAESTVPKTAADIANAYAQAYVDFRRRQAIDDVLDAATEVKAKIDELQKQIDTSVGATRDSLIEQQALFKNKLDELQVSASLQSGGGQIVSQADVPSSPVRPKPLRNGILAVVLGGMLGLGLAFLIEYLDDSIKSKEDVERAAPSVTVLSMIPSISNWKAKDEPRIISISDPNAPAAETYRTLRTSIQFMAFDRTLRSIQVTSPNAGEGKTTTTANLGVALARSGARVVIACCDLRRPRVHEFFGLTNKVGFTSVMLGEASLSDAMQRVPGIDRLYLLASGPLPPNPSELLHSRRAMELLNYSQFDCDFLLLDTPPVLPVSDALVVSKIVDGTLLVCGARTTSRKEFARSVELLQNVEAPIIGAVLNGVAADASYGYSYRYYRSDRAHEGNGAAALLDPKRPRGKSQERRRTQVPE